MARTFTETNYLEDGSWSAITAAPFTLSLWFYAPADTGDDDCMFMLSDNTVSNHYLRLTAAWDRAGTPLEWASNDASIIEVRTTNSMSVGAWQHGCGIEASSSSRRVILNGNWASSSQDTSSHTPSGINSIAIGYENDSSPGDNWEGDLAEVALWNVALVQAEVEALAAGYSPLFIRPQNLVSYFPLIRGEEDRMGISTMTETGSVGVATHPPIIYPSPLFQGFAAAGAPPAGLSIPVAMRYFRNMRT